MTKEMSQKRKAVPVTDRANSASQTPQKGFPQLDN